MENTRNSAVNWAKVRNRTSKAAAAALTVFLICRCSVTGASFPAAAALISCMVSRNPVNILMLVPAAGAIIPYAFRGYDLWGDLIAAAVCGVFFLVSRHLQMEAWQKALIASSVTIVCISIYRLATVTVYRTDIRTLILEGALVFVMFIVFDIIYDLVKPVISGQSNGPEQKMKELLDFKIAEMQEMGELYGTYLDSRSMLADQFRITEQIMEDLQLKMGSTTEREHNMREKFQMDISISQLAASGLINGDCCGWSDIGRGRIAMVVSDGMGKGKKAAAESLMVTRTIISLLKSGVTAELTLKMINTIMLMKDDEDSYATVDLVIVDRKSGRSRFYKIGAAPTLIKRREHVEEVKLSAVPLGIVNGLKIRYLETTLKKDDWIIMMSDGVSDGGSSRSSEDSRAFLQHLKKTASEVKTAEPHIMSRLLMERAEESYRGRERDDLTVMVARLC